MPFIPDDAPQKPSSFKPDADSNPMDAYRARHANDSVTDKLKSILVGDKDSPIVQGEVPVAIPAGAMASVVPKLAQFLTKAGPGATAALNGGIGGVKGAMKPANSIEDRAENAAVGGGKAALISLASSLLGGGLKRGADHAMQDAVGMKSYEPGVGNILADEGVVGTKNMMKGQVADKLNDAEDALQSKVSALDGSISSMNPANSIDAQAGGYMTRTGDVPDEAQGAVDQIKNRAQNVLQRGQVSPGEALDYMRIAGKEGYAKNGLERSPLGASLARIERHGYGEGLRDLDKSGEVGNLLDKERAMLEAARGLNKNDKIASLGDLLSSLVSHLPGRSAIPALAGQALQKAGNTVSNPVLREEAVKRATD